MDVIPAINCPDAECAKKELAAAREFSKKGDWVHLDVADGVFTFNKTWGDPTRWANLREPLNLEAHLMVAHPERSAEAWFAAGARRIIVHAEAVHEKSLAKILESAARVRAEVMLSSNPETPAEKLEPYFGKLREFQVLCVHPGFAGQKFLTLTLGKVRFLRSRLPGAKIEVDGGVDAETGKLAKAAGADILVAASYIFGNADPVKAYETLKKI